MLQLILFVGLLARLFHHLLKSVGSVFRFISDTELAELCDKIGLMVWHVEGVVEFGQTF